MTNPEEEFEIELTPRQPEIPPLALTPSEARCQDRKKDDLTYESKHYMNQLKEDLKHYPEC